MSPSLDSPSRPELPAAYALVELDQVDSVLAEASRRATAGAEEGTLVWAHTQTDARGRRGQPWLSPPGNLYCALVIRPDFPLEAAVQLTYVASVSVGLALANVLTPMTGLRYACPNDLLINEGRAGSIQLQIAGGAGGTPEWLALGVYVNVLAPPQIPDVFTNSVYASGTHEVSVTLLLEGFARHFLSWINRWSESGFAPVRKAWLQRLEGIGDKICLQLDGDAVEGVLRGLDDIGNVIIERPAGEQRVAVLDLYPP